MISLGGWFSTELPDGIVHVHPENDWCDHVLSRSCWCGAVTDAGGVVVHRAMDQRELYETGMQKLN